MPKTITVPEHSYDVFTYEELSEDAQQNAVEWFADGYPDHEWWDSTYENAERVGLKITSFDLDRNRHAKGYFIDGAEPCANATIKEHGESCETFKTAKEYLKNLETINNLFPEADDDNENKPDNYSSRESATEELDDEFLKSILEDYSIMLQKECEYLQSREHIEESIILNEYTFDENGKRKD